MMIKTVLCWPSLMLALLSCGWSSRGLTQAAGSSTPAASQGGEVGQPAAPESWALHGQATFVVQGHDRFTSPFSGTNSLDAGTHVAETADITLYSGAKLWRGAQVWINPEIDQGFGLSNTIGVAGFVSGEAYKVGAHTPYFRLHRLFVRQTIDLGGGKQAVGADLNQLAGPRSANRVVLTIGKLSAGDIFDTNTYAHDPRSDFLNWSIIEAGNLDYAADAWGYTAGATVEWYRGRWVARTGAFLLSNVPNSEFIDTSFRQTQFMAEIEEGHSLFGQPGKLKVTGFVTHGRQGRFADAVALARLDGGAADTVPVRRLANRSGVSVNLEQAITPELGVFARAGYSDGSQESFDFTDIDRTFSGGVSIRGKRWDRPGDTIGTRDVLRASARPASARTTRWRAVSRSAKSPQAGALTAPSWQSWIDAFPERESLFFT